MSVAVNALPRVTVRSLGTWGAGMRLLSEYDPQTRTIALDRSACERVRAHGGAAFLARFMICAVAHELFHIHFPRASEARAHAFARLACGEDPAAFEAALRA